MRALFLILVYLGWVGSAQAAVLINEVAWMGNEESHLCEWIELYNDSTEAVSLTNWSLQIGDGPIKPFADGEFSTFTIPSGGYVVIERLVASCSDPVPGKSDGYVAFGSIPNTDTTIKLFRDVDGTDLADQLASGEDWSEIGGDNETKDTAQYASSGWYTAAPTPGTKNAATRTSEPGASAQAAESNAKSGRSSERNLSTKSETTTISLAEQSRRHEPLTVAISYPTTVYVGQTVTFTAEPDGRGETVRNSLRYQWNFGDLTTAAGPEATHRYQFPGEYVVAVRASYNEYEATDTRTVVVLPVTIRMNITADGHLNIHNTAPYEVDVSGYTLSTNPPITFPPQSKFVPKGTITVPNAKLGTNAAAIALRDATENVISSTEPMTSLAATTHPTPTTNIARATPQVAGVNDTTPTTASEEAEAARTTQEEAPLNAPQQTNFLAGEQSVPSTPQSPETLWWYGLLLALIGVGVTAIFLVTGPSSVPQDERLAEDY